MLEAKHAHSTATAERTRTRTPTRRGILVGAIGTIAATGAAATDHRRTDDDAALLAALAAFEAYERQIIAHFRRGNPAFIKDDDERDTACTPIEAAQAPFVDLACTMRGHTIAGVQARARALLLWDQDLATRVAGTAPVTGSIGERMTVALLRDLSAVVA